LKEKEAELTNNREAKLKDIEERVKMAKQSTSQQADNARLVSVDDNYNVLIL